MKKTAQESKTWTASFPYNQRAAYVILSRNSILLLAVFVKYGVSNLFGLIYRLNHSVSLSS